MRHVLNIFIGLFTLCISAQVTAPQASPSAKAEQMVGLTTIELAYSRPAARGRTIFGDLVSFGKKWRTGANKNTTVSFSDDVVVGSKGVKAGTYAIYAIPNKDMWTIYLYDKTDSWGLPQEWDDALVVAEVSVKAQKTDLFFESFTIMTNHISSNKAHIQVAWENTMVEFPVEVPTDEKVMTSIESVMNGPSARDYFDAAVYFLNEGKDINKAKSWIDTAMSMQENKPYWMLRQQSLIYAKAGDKKGAIKLAEQSLAAAKAAGNMDYVKMNENSLQEWK